MIAEKELATPTVEQAIAAIAAHAHELTIVTTQLQAEVDRRKGAGHDRGTAHG